MQAEGAAHSKRKRSVRMGSTVWIIAAFGAYMTMMIVIGALYMKKTNNSEDYFLGGRGLGGWVAALSAQASDMSGWLLMGLPGAVYAYGTGQAWIAIGLLTPGSCAVTPFGPIIL